MKKELRLLKKGGVGGKKGKLNEKSSGMSTINILKTPLIHMMNVSFISTKWLLL